MTPVEPGRPPWVCPETVPVSFVAGTLASETEEAVGVSEAPHPTRGSAATASRTMVLLVMLTSFKEGSEGIARNSPIDCSCKNGAACRSGLERGKVDDP